MPTAFSGVHVRAGLYFVVTRPVPRIERRRDRRAEVHVAEARARGTRRRTRCRARRRVGEAVDAADELKRLSGFFWSPGSPPLFSLLLLLFLFKRKPSHISQGVYDLRLYQDIPRSENHRMRPDLCQNHHAISPLYPGTSWYHTPAYCLTAVLSLKSRFCSSAENTEKSITAAQRSTKYFRSVYGVFMRSILPWACSNFLYEYVAE